MAIPESGRRSLMLIIKEKYLLEIVAGTKTEETREIRPKNAKRYVDVSDPETIDIVQYDEIKFYAGYNKNRKSATIEVLDARVEFLLNSDGTPIFYEEDGIEYMMADIIYSLGKVLEKNF